VQECGQRIFELMLKVASGEPTKSESFDFDRLGKSAHLGHCRSALIANSASPRPLDQACDQLTNVPPHGRRHEYPLRHKLGGTRRFPEAVSDIVFRAPAGVQTDIPPPPRKTTSAGSGDSGRIHHGS
jgi:hypothetical protein